MNIRSTVLACACLLATATPLLAETVAPAGKDDRVEWQVTGRWQVDAVPVDIVHSLDGKLVFILDDQHRILVYNAQGQLQGRVPVGEGVTRIDIAPQGEALYLIDGTTNSFTSLAMSFVQDIDVAGSPFRGNANAEVTLAVFTDFE